MAYLVSLPLATRKLTTSVLNFYLLKNQKLFKEGLKTNLLRLKISCENLRSAMVRIAYLERTFSAGNTKPLLLQYGACRELLLRLFDSSI